MKWCFLSAFEHSELGLFGLLVGLAVISSLIVIITEVRDAVFLASCACTVRLVLVSWRWQIWSLLVEVLQIDLFTAKLDDMVSLAFIHISKLA